VNQNPDTETYEPKKDIVAEQSILAAILIEGENGVDNNAMIKAMTYLEPKMFYKTDHLHIFNIMQKLFSNNEPIDCITVSTKIRELKLEIDVHLVDIRESIPSSANVQSYINSVLEMYRLRSIAEKGIDIQRSVENNKSSTDIISNISEFTLQFIKNNQDEKPWRQILHETADIIGTDKIRGFDTPLTKFNRYTGGLNKHLIVIGARPSHGKTAFAFQFLLHLAKNGVECGFISFEMSDVELAIRALAYEAKVNSTDLRDGKLGGDGMGKLNRAYIVLEKIPFHMKEMATANVFDVESILRAWKKKHNIQISAIDYLQLMEHNGENRTQAIGNTTRRLKNLQAELDCGILLLSQLSRQNETNNREPRLSDLRDSGSIEQDAQDVVFIHNPDYDDSEDTAIAKIIIAKQRNGPTGAFESTFIKEWAGFENYTKDIPF